MNSFKKNKFSKNSKVIGDFCADNLDLRSSKVDSKLYRFTKAQDAITWERIRLLEYNFVKAVEKKN